MTVTGIFLLGCGAIIGVGSILALITDALTPDEEAPHE